MEQFVRKMWYIQSHVNENEIDEAVTEWFLSATVAELFDLAEQHGKRLKSSSSHEGIDLDSFE
eukprot:1680484-Amphidinium_carterae.1